MSTTDPFSDIISKTLGACFIGFLFAAIMYGVTCTQTYTYFARNARDEPFLKFLIMILWVLGTLHLSFIAAALYHYFVQNFDDLASIVIPFWSLPTMVAISAAIECIVRGVFISKVWILSRKLWVSALLGILNAFVFVVGILFAVKAFQVKTFTEFFTNDGWIVYLAFSMNLFLDVSITACLAFFLRRIRRGHSSTTRFIDKLIRSIVNTGILTTAMSFGVLILFGQDHNSFAFMAMYFPLSQVFFAALLASLNLRQSLREARLREGPGEKIPVSDNEAEFEPVRSMARPFRIAAWRSASDTSTPGATTHGGAFSHGDSEPTVEALSPNRGPPTSDYPPATPIKARTHRL